MRLSPVPVIAALALACTYAQGAAVITPQDLKAYAETKHQELNRYAQANQYQQAVEVLEEFEALRRALGVEESQPGTMQALAMCYASLGEKDKAIGYLKQIAERGEPPLEWFIDNSCFDSLREDPAFKEILAREAAAKALWQSPALATPYQENIGEGEKIAGLAKFWMEVKYNFAFLDRRPDLDWEALYLEYLPKVRATTSTREYYRVLQEMCAKLKDSHTGVYLPDELQEATDARPPVGTQLVEGRVLVTERYDEALAKSGIEPGLEVVTVDGVPVREYVAQRVLPYLSVSTPQTRDDWAYRVGLLAGSKGSTVQLGLRDEQGRTFTRELTRVARQDLKGRPWKPFEYKSFEGGIAYVALNTVGDESVISSFDAAFPEIETAEALIIDVRENGGGSSHIGWGILAYLTDRPFRQHSALRRKYDPYGRASGRNPWSVERIGDRRDANGAKLFAKPVVVLIGPRTGSAAEDFCVAFEAMDRGEMIGEPTGGSTGQPLHFRLPGGGSARVCTIEPTYPDGRGFVGIGIQPDILVQPTVADIRAGRDTVLNAALNYLRRELRR